MVFQVNTIFSHQRLAGIAKVLRDRHAFPDGDRQCLAATGAGRFQCRVDFQLRNADKKEPTWISDPRPAHLEGIQDWLSVTAMAASAETVASTEAAEARVTTETVATEARVSAKTTAGCEAPRDAAAEARRSGAHGHHARGGRHHP
jgi:hypothetical protein